MSFFIAKIKNAMKFFWPKLGWKYMESAHVMWLKNIRIGDLYGNSGGFGMDLVLRRNPKIELNLFMWGLSFYISPIRNLK